MSELGFRMQESAPTGRRRVLPWLVVTALLLGIAGGGLVLLTRSLAPPQDYQGQGTGSVQVDVRGGASLRQIADTLVDAGVVANAESFMAVVTEAGGNVAPGRYTLRGQMSPADAYELMQNPDSRAGSRLVITEGMRLKEIVAEAARVSGIPESQFRAALTRPDAIGLPTLADGNPEGWLFPATYDVAPNASATDLLRLMTARFDKAVEDLDLAARAAKVGLSAEEAVVVASLLEGESAPEDYSKVARVIYNRLDKGMKLQLDSTVNYALGTDDLRLTAEQLKVDSPYNTYLAKGLPPGPIGSPGEAALEAALNPAPGDWLYFVTTDPKARTTEFAVTEREFLALKKKYQAGQP